MEKYNGWTNRDTWLVNLWLNNDEKNYKRLTNSIKGIGCVKLAKCSDLSLINRLKQYYYGDKINWNNVNVSEIREMLLEITEIL